METAIYFLRYALPIVISTTAVLLLALVNVFVLPCFLPARLAERMEVLAYSILYVGPWIFSLVFLCSFYGFELLKENWTYARIIFLISVGLLIIALLLNVLFLPKVKC